MGEKELSNPKDIFNRFYKENPSSQSVGLGLAVVKKICDLYHIKILYGFSENRHCFTLQFNL
jgi:signal transduction histidine kinase